MPTMTSKSSPSVSPSAAAVVDPLAQLAAEIESVMIEVELPDLDKLLIRAFVIDPALYDVADEQQHQQQQQSKMQVRTNSSKGRREHGTASLASTGADGKRREYHAARLAAVRTALVAYRASLFSLLEAVQARERVWAALQWWRHRISRENNFFSVVASSDDDDDGEDDDEYDNEKAKYLVTGGRVGGGNITTNRRSPSPVLSPARAASMSRYRSAALAPQQSRTLFLNNTATATAATTAVATNAAAAAAAIAGGGGRRRAASFTPVAPSSYITEIPSTGGSMGGGGSATRRLSTPLVPRLPHHHRHHHHQQQQQPLPPASSPSTAYHRRSRLPSHSGPGPGVNPTDSADGKHHTVGSGGSGSGSGGRRSDSPESCGVRQRRRRGSGTSAVPRRIHRECMTYLLSHLQRTTVAVVAGLRRWRRHLTHPFPFILQRQATNYSLEVVLQALRLSADPAMRHALGQPAGIEYDGDIGGGDGMMATPVRDWSRTAPDLSGSINNSGKRRRNRKKKHGRLNTTSNTMMMAMTTPGSASGTPSKTNRSYEDGNLSERRRARQRARAAAAWPEALAAFPLASAYPGISGCGAGPPPAYLVDVASEEAEVEMEGGGGSGASPPSQSSTTAAAPFRELLLLVADGDGRPPAGSGNSKQRRKHSHKGGSIRRPKDKGTGEETVAVSAVDAERWLCRDISRQLQCCHTCMAAATSSNTGGSPESDANSIIGGCGGVRPVLLLSAFESLLGADLAGCRFSRLVEADAAVAQLWGYWLADVDAWYRHLEEASSALAE